MDNAVFTLLFLATAPIVLMPSAIALFAKNKHASAIVVVNLLAWAGIWYLLHAVVVDGSRSGLALPLPLAFITWLVLLRFAISGDRSTPRSNPSSSGRDAPDA